MKQDYISILCVTGLMACSNHSIAGNPSQTETAKLTANDPGTNNGFGYSIASSGSLVVVGSAGATHNGITAAGLVYVFDLATGQQIDKLTASDPDTNDVFGGAVAVSGTTAVIGAFLDDHSGYIDPGSAYVFDLTTGQQIYKLTADFPFISDRFGTSVAISDTTILIGEPNDWYNGIYRSGSASLFDLTTGLQIDKLAANDVTESASFGDSVAISGSIAVIGAPTYDFSGSEDNGAAYAFDLTTGRQIAKLTASDSAFGDNFGHSVAVSGSIAIIGAPYNDHSGLINPGAVYVFDLTTGQQIAKLTANDSIVLAQFGSSVAISGSTLLIGSQGFNPAGAAYVFDLTTGQQVDKLTASDRATNDDLGCSVTIAGSTAVVGAYRDSHSGFFQAGSVYLYDLPSQICQADLNNDNQLDFFDISTFLSAYSMQEEQGDFNNDGFFDFFDISAFLTSYQAGCP